MSESIDQGGFRDGRAGARARRDQLLRRRRDEYALMPHRVRRIYVRRVARAVTGAAAALGAGVVVVAACSPRVHGALLQIVPGAAPAVLSTYLLATWIALAWGYFAARSFAEERFARVTARTVRPGAVLPTPIPRPRAADPDPPTQGLFESRGIAVLPAAVASRGVFCGAT